MERSEVMGRGAIVAAALVLGLGLALNVRAQEPQADSLALSFELTPPEGFEYKDSVIYVQTPLYNELLAGRDIFQIMPPGVTIIQSGGLENAVRTRIRENAGNQLESDGFRIRIYFDNKQNSREVSESEQRRFEALFPGYNTYRSYNYPNFKVTVGDFRTKAEAEIALKSIARRFPSAFIVKEKMKFPVISQTRLYTLDTLKVLVPIFEPDKAE